MQQTKNYKLNLIETSDTFSPSPLNENMEKVEGALDTKADAAQTKAATNALDKRLKVLEARKIAYGICEDSNSVIVGFTPVVVIMAANGSGNVAMAVAGVNDHAFIENGFRPGSLVSYVQNSGIGFLYVAIG